MDLPLPVQLLNVASAVYPGVWRQADALRADRGQALPAWPDWCFLPHAGWYALVCEVYGLDFLDEDHIGQVSRLAALGGWRATQRIYAFDSEIYAALASTPLAGDIPAEVLFRLPDWCVYVETPGLAAPDGEELSGAFVHLEHDVNSGQAELRFLLATPSGQLSPQFLPLGTWSVDEALQRAGQLASFQAGVDLGPHMNFAALRGTLQPLLNLALYLCSEAPDLRLYGGAALAAGKPQAKKTKSGWRIFPPDKATRVAVGEDLGGQIRQAAAAGREHPHKGPRPHIRRAHWHGYWMGPRKDGQRFELRWLPPIPVAMGEDEEA